MSFNSQLQKFSVVHSDRVNHVNQEVEPEVQVWIVVTQTYLICRESRHEYAPIVCIQHLF
jgi:hypothetical protein